MMKCLSVVSVCLSLSLSLSVGEFALGAADPQAMRMEFEKALKAYYDTSEEDKESVKANP